MRHIGNIYTRCTYCGLLTVRDGECDDCGYTGVCHICGDSLEDELRRSTQPTLCADPHCYQEWSDQDDR